MRMSWRSARSSASRSIRRLWTRISQCPTSQCPRRRATSGRHLEGLRRQRDRTAQVDAGVVRDLADVVADVVQVVWTRARESNACLLHLFFLVNFEDLSGGDGLTHVADGEAPKFGISLDGSMLRGFCGRMVTTAASPDWMKSGFSPATSPLAGPFSCRWTRSYRQPGPCAWKTGV